MALPAPLGGSPFALRPMTAIFLMERFDSSGRKSFLFSRRTMPSRAALIAASLEFSAASAIAGIELPGDFQ